MLTLETEYVRSRAIVAAIDSLESGSVSAEREVFVRHALAALMRCRSLLVGIVELDQAGRGDTIGLHLRAMLETWYYAYLALYGTSSDLERLAADHRYYKNQLAETLGLEGDQGQEKRFSVFQRAKRVDELLTAADDSNPKLAIGLYRSVFASESLTDVHPSIQSMARYINIDAAGMEVSINPEPTVDPQARLAKIVQAEMWVSLLAKSIWIELDADPSTFDQLVAPINVAVDVKARNNFTDGS